MNGLLLAALELPKLVFVAVLGVATGIGAAGKSAYEMVAGSPEACQAATIGDRADAAVPLQEEGCSKTEQLKEAPGRSGLP